VLFVAYGTVARICKTAIDTLKTRGEGGAFPTHHALPLPGRSAGQDRLQAKHVLVSEMSCGQMVEDARYHVAGKRPVAFYGRVAE